MKKLKGTKRLRVSRNPPGTTPKSAHKTLSNKGRSTPKNSHPGKNLGKFLYDKAELPRGTKIGAAKSVAKSITKSKKGMLNV